MNGDPSDDEVRELFRIYNVMVESVGKEMMAAHLDKSANSYRNETNVESFLAGQGRAKLGLVDMIRTCNRVVDPYPFVAEINRLMGYAAPLTVAQAETKATAEEMAIELLRIAVRYYEMLLEAKDPGSECGIEIGPNEGKTLKRILDGVQAVVEKARGGVDAETVAVTRRMRVVRQG